MIQEYGQYIVANPKICHGKLTFRGTRLFVSDILEDVADGQDWNDIIKNWHGSITCAAISDAIRYAKEAFLEQSAAQQIPELIAA